MIVSESIVSFKVAKLLEQAGFEGDYNLLYDQNGHLYVPSAEHMLSWNYKLIKAPSISVAVKWVRLNYNLHIETPCCNHNGKIVYSLRIVDLTTMKYEFGCSCPFEIANPPHKLTPEDAQESVLLYCLRHKILNKE